MFHVDVYFLAAIAGVAAFAWTAFQSWRSTRKSVMQDVIHHALTPIRTKLASIETSLAVLTTQVNPMWAGWNANIAHNATVLHHPEPSRARVDYLLDCLRDKTITPEELDELRTHLEIIMNWEPGVEAPYKIFQGEQTAAANMLSALDVVHSEYVDNGLCDPSAGSTEEAGTGLPD